ncbi:MAG: heavy metal-binding domain-containing protein, partial [Acidobacteria bacterium]|nr:heavy metal-binding domain-containing protein [Acidobacteriota bacterium]
MAGISAARRASVPGAVSRRSAACRKTRRQARWPAFADLTETARLGAYAIVDVDIDYEVITRRGSMPVSITGTAVSVGPGTGADAVPARHGELPRRRAARCGERT